MNKAELRFDREYTIGQVDPHMKGSFVEHLGRCMYNGLYEPEHPTADRFGFRNDVKKLIQDLGVTCIRYPGGNFVSGYNWKDGIGPREQRPLRRELAWNTIETNQIGTDEFASLCRELNVELIMACNLGTGTPQEAGELVEYCRGAEGTAWSELRKKNGFPEPYNIHYWCLGNEMDGPWQIQAMEAADYAKKARETAKIIGWTDPEARMIACGTCTNELGHSTYGSWDQTVLETAYDEIDCLSLHRYYNYHSNKKLFYPMTDDISDIPFFFSDLSDYIETILHACDYVRGKLRKEKRIMISFDEWGLAAETGAIPGGVKQQYAAATFTALDAVLYGGIICTLLNHSDRIKIACQSLLVNEGGMITTVPGGIAFRQATYWPFRDMAHLITGVSLRGIGELPYQETGHHGAHPTLICHASHDPEKHLLTLLAANCDLEKDCEVSVRFTGFGSLCRASRRELYTEDPNETNTFDRPDAVIPHEAVGPTLEGNVIRFIAKKHSWNVIQISTTD